MLSPKLTYKMSNEIERKLEELIKSVTFMGIQFDEFNNKLGAALLEMKHLRIENDKIQSENILYYLFLK